MNAIYKGLCVPGKLISNCIHDASLNYVELLLCSSWVFTNIVIIIAGLRVYSVARSDL